MKKSRLVLVFLMLFSCGEKVSDDFLEGKKLFEEGEFIQAIEFFDKALLIEPENPQIYHARGLTKKNIKDYTGAMADYDKAIYLNPKYDLAYNNRAVLKGIKLDKNGALVDFNLSISINPEKPLYYINRAVLLIHLENYESALNDLQYIKNNFDYKALNDFYYARGKALAGLGNYIEAEKDFNLCLTNKSRYKQKALVELGIISIGRLHHEEALVFFKKS